MNILRYHKGKKMNNILIGWFIHITNIPYKQKAEGSKGAIDKQT